MDPVIFINYRTDDSLWHATLLYNELANRFGSELVFQDRESIPAGDNYVDALLAGASAAEILLALIGPRWLTASATHKPDAHRRTHDEIDWVHRELVVAFASGVRVIPILTGGTELPAADELPTNLAALTTCQALPLRRRRPSVDLAEIVNELLRLNTRLRQAFRPRDTVRESVPQWCGRCGTQ